MRGCFVIGRGGDHDELGIPICCFFIGRDGEIQRFMREIFFDLAIGDRGLLCIDQLGFLLCSGHCSDTMILCKKHSEGKTDISYSCDSDFHGILLVGIDYIDGVILSAKIRCGSFRVGWFVIRGCFHKIWISLKRYLNQVSTGNTSPFKNF